MTMEHPALLAWCQAHRAEHIDLLKRLAVIPAPTHHEQARAQFIRTWLTQAGAQHVRQDSQCNVILSLGGEEGGAFTLFSAHIDVVFPDTAPLPLEERDGRLYAPGVGDNTANAAALMMCAKYILEHGLRPRTPVLLVFNSCEEGLGNLKGMRRLMDEYQGRIREAVCFDLTYDTVMARSVGSERWKITASTKGGHSFLDFGSPNAIAHLAGLIGRLYQQPVPAQPGQTTTYNVGTISGGTSVNTIAQRAELTYEYRSNDRACLAQMRAQFRQILEQTAAEGVQLETQLLGERPCACGVDEERLEGLLHRCTQAAQTAVGVAPRRVSLSTDANLPLSLGIPAVTVGLCRGALPHTRQEYVEVDSLTPGLAMGLELILPLFA